MPCPSPSVRSLFPVTLAALAALSSGCGAPEDALDEDVQGVDIRVAVGGSLAAAINRANPGDRILVPAGTYAGGGWIERSGTAAAPITVVSADGPRRAVIQGGGEALRVGNSAYLVFDGFEVRNAGDNCVHVDNSHHVTLRNLYVHDAGVDGDAVKVNQSHHITVERSELARPGPRSAGGPNPYQECLDFVDVDDSAIRDNFIHDGGSMLAYVKGGSRNPVIERNVFSQQRAGASDPVVGLGGYTDSELLGGERYEVINAVFRNNVVVGGVAGGLAVYDAQGAYVANNLFLNNDAAVVDFRAGNGPAGGSTNVQVVNNLVVDTRGRMPTPFRRSGHTLSGLATSYNTFWNNGAALPTSSLLTLAAQVGHLATNPLVSAPAATAARDVVLAAVRPRAGSPAAATGLVASASPFGVTDDIALVARGSSRDRGPFVLNAAPAPAPADAGVADASVADAGTTTGMAVTAVNFTSSGAGVVGRATTVTATSAGSSAPRYSFRVRNPAGTWSQPCGGYTAVATCSFTPNAAGTWQVRVWARDARSTAQYQATSGDRPYAVTAPATGGACPPEATQRNDRGDPVGVVSGHVRYCWPGEALCYCDADNDCYAEAGYRPCSG